MTTAPVSLRADLPASSPGRASTAELVGTGQVGTIYLLHFDRPLHHARHYLGWASDLEARLAVHGKADGSALMRAVAAAGIDWQLARTWTGDRHRERQLKQRGKARMCPLCRAEAIGQSALPINPATSTSQGGAT